MRLSSVVTVQDVSEAVRLMKVSMQQSSIDPRTGQIDMDLIQTGEDWSQHLVGGASGWAMEGQRVLGGCKSWPRVLPPCLHMFLWLSDQFAPAPPPSGPLPAGVSATDRTMKAQLVGELRNLLEQKVGPAGLG
jgi:hypothetical protein